MATQATARTPSNGGVAGGRNHGGEGLKATLGMSEGDGANGGGTLGADSEPMDWNNTEGQSVARCGARGSTRGQAEMAHFRAEVDLRY